jgi:hypothetical protein
MKLKKVLSICKTNGLYYLYDRIDRSGEITQWLGDACALYPLDGLPILDEESFCAVFDITGKQREKILFRHERLPEHLNVEDVAAGDKLVREYETTFINGGLRLKPLKTNNGVTFIRSLYLSPLEAAGGGGNLPRGAVIGTVEIVDCVPVEELVDSLDNRERLLGDYSPGRFAWVLQNPVMFKTPIPAHGKQGWWNWEEPT